MAGTIFGLPLSQRVDANGDPLIGWLLYLYIQNSSTPVNSYSDTALTVLNPWPIQADASGMMGIFWLADGSYRVRATSNDGSVTLYDLPSVQAIGPSTGSAPSGGVDPNAIFQTGYGMWLDLNEPLAGWVRDNGRTIGSATSGGTERQNADCHALFLFLWTKYSDALCPVLTGRGLNAEADWLGNKQITLPDKRGYVPGGLDDMGNSAASRWTGVPIVSGTVTTAGAKIGENRHTLIEAELATHDHNINITDPQHHHSYTLFTAVQTITGGAGPAAGGSVSTASTSNNSTGITADSDTAGSNTAHNNVPLVALGTFYRKL